MPGSPKGAQNRVTSVLLNKYLTNEFKRFFAYPPHVSVSFLNFTRVCFFYVFWLKTYFL